MVPLHKVRVDHQRKCHRCAAHVFCRTQGVWARSYIVSSPPWTTRLSTLCNLQTFYLGQALMTNGMLPCVCSTHSTTDTTHTRQPLPNRIPFAAQPSCAPPRMHSAPAGASVADTAPAYPPSPISPPNPPLLAPARTLGPVYRQTSAPMEDPTPGDAHVVRMDWRQYRAMQLEGMASQTKAKQSSKPAAMQSRPQRRVVSSGSSSMVSPRYGHNVGGRNIRTCCTFCQSLFPITFSHNFHPPRITCTHQVNIFSSVQPSQHHKQS